MTSEESKRTCFVIAPIGESESDIRRWSDQVLKYIIRPAVEPYGYEAVRADDIDKPGIITSQVIQRVFEEPLVIADLTERNPNVFYELAIRHAARKPFIQLINESESIPFDLAPTRTILLNIHDLGKVEKAKEQIGEHISSLESDPQDLETPISVTLDLQRLRQSENPEERYIADMASTLSEIRSNLSSLEQRLARRINASQTESLIMMHDLRRYLQSSLNISVDRHEQTRGERRLHRMTRNPLPPTLHNDATEEPIEDIPW